MSRLWRLGYCRACAVNQAIELPFCLYHILLIQLLERAVKCQKSRFRQTEKQDVSQIIKNLALKNYSSDLINFRNKKLIIMKKIIISLSVAGFISLGFTVVGNNLNSKDEHVKIEQNTSLETINGSIDNADKRLASWD